MKNEYPLLIIELNEELNEGLLKPTEYIKIIRDSDGDIIDYCYADEFCEDAFTLQNVMNVLQELEYK